MIVYRAMLDVPTELVRYLARLLATERNVLGTRRGTRALTCHYQALLVLVWFRKGEDKTLLGAGFGVSRATAYRYVAEGIKVLTAQAPDLHTALQRVADEGWSHVILDGKLFRTHTLHCLVNRRPRAGRAPHAINGPRTWASLHLPD